MNCSYDLIFSLGTPTLPMFPFCSDIFVNGKVAQEKVVSHIAVVKLFVLSFGALVRAHRIWQVKRSSFSRLMKDFNGHGGLRKVPDAVLEKCFDFGTLWLIEATDVDLTLAFVAVAGFYEVEGYDLGSHDCFLYGYMTRKLSRGIGSASMARTLTDGT